MVEDLLQTLLRHTEMDMDGTSSYLLTDSDDFELLMHDLTPWSDYGEASFGKRRVGWKSFDKASRVELESKLVDSIRLTACPSSTSPKQVIHTTAFSGSDSSSKKKSKNYRLRQGARSRLIWQKNNLDKNWKWEIFLIYKKNELDLKFRNFCVSSPCSNNSETRILGFWDFWTRKGRLFFWLWKLLRNI